MGYCRRALLDYSQGKVASIPELEEDILTFEKDNESIYLNFYGRSYTSSAV